MLLVNCHVISPGEELSGIAIRIAAGRIVEICPDSGAEEEGRIDCSGLTLLPGFIDVHTHGAASFDFCDGTLEALEGMAAAKVREGVTSFLPTTTTVEEETLFSAFAAARAYATGKKAGARLLGVHLEGPFINPAALGAQNGRYVQSFNLDLIDRLHAIFPIAKVTFAPELPGAADFASALLERGIVASCGHSHATFAQFSAIREAGAKSLTHFGNQMGQMHHREIGLVGAGLYYDDVSLEIIPDLLHISPDMIRLAMKNKPLSSIQLVTDSMRASGMVDGEYGLGGLEVVKKDGAARLKDSGALAGSVLAYNHGWRNFATVTGRKEKDIVAATSFNQAAALGRDGHLGRIAPGMDGDIVCLDKEGDVAMTIVQGEIRYRRD